MPFSSGGELAVLLPPDLLVLESSEGNSVHIMVSLDTNGLPDGGFTHGCIADRISKSVLFLY